MEAKEKAEELINKMFGLDLEDLTKFDYIDHVAAKHFALIAVDGILGFIEDDRQDFNWKKYYQEVKQEIEKL